MNNTRTDSRLFRQCAALSLSPSKGCIIATVAITATACPFTILLNALILIAVGLKKELRTIPTILLTSLAVTDLLVGTVAEPLFISAGILSLQNDYETTCVLIIAGLFAMHLICTSIYHLTAMAWERYQAITNAIKYRVIVTRGRVTMFAIASWVLTALSILPSALYLPGFIDQSQNNILKACFFSVPMTICLVAIPVFYILIYNETRRRQQAIVPQANSQSAANAAAERKVAKTTFMLTMALFLSFAPTAVLLVLAHVFNTSTEDIFQWLVTFNQLNSLANPILYFYRNQRLRNTVLEMLHMRKPSANPIPGRNAPHGINRAMTQTTSRGNTSPTMLVEQQERSKMMPRGKTTSTKIDGDTMPSREERNSLNRDSGISSVSGREDSNKAVTQTTSQGNQNPIIPVEQQETTKVQREKTTPIKLDDDAMPSRKERSPPNQDSGLPGVSGMEDLDIRTATMKVVGIQRNPVTLGKKDEEPHQVDVHAKNTGSAPGREKSKSRRLPKCQISPTEVSQDPNNAMQSSCPVNRTQTRPNAWEICVIEGEECESHHVHGYAKTTRSLPESDKGKSRRLPKCQVSPAELSQDPNNAMQSSCPVNRTPTKSNAWEICVIEEQECKPDPRHFYAKNTKSAPGNEELMIKSRRLTHCQISPTELSQDGNESSCSVNRTDQTKPIARGANVIEEDEHESHRVPGYAKKARSVLGGEERKSRRLPKCQMSPTEVSQDPYSAIQSHTQTRRNALKINVIEKGKQDDLKAKQEDINTSLQN